MRVAFACLAVLALAAGCTQTGTHPSTTTPAGPAPPALAGGWQLDCTLGGYEQARNASWGQACEARASHSPGPKEETWAQINPTDPRNVVVGAKDLNPASSDHCVWNGVFVTHDSGATWRDVTIGGTFASRGPTSPFYGYQCNTDPDFRFDAKGDLHYGIEMYQVESSGQKVPDPSGFGSGYKILLATSHDGGDTFPDVITYQPDIVLVTDYSRMAVSPTTQTVLEAIGSEGGVGCNVLRWAAGAPAATFEPVATKDGVPCNSGAGSGIAVSPTGTVVLIGAAGVVARSTDDGMTFADSNPLFTFTPIPGTFKESKYRTPGTVETAYDTSGPNKGTLYACYPAADRKGDEADIYVRSSKDDGRTWSDAAMVNQDAPGAHQWMCNIGVGGDGSVHVFFFDKQYDPAHTLIDVTHGVSLDGGKTWRTERVSTVSFDGNLGVHQEGFPFIGDYIGVNCVGNDCWAGFPDASNGKTTVIAAAHVHRSA
jgi:hypothetical protein